MKKRLLALILTVIMVLTSFMGSLPTLAADQPLEETLTEEKVEAPSVLGDVELPDAVEVAPSYREGVTPIDATAGLTFGQLDDDHIKLVGRTNIENNYLRVSFSGTGFKIRVDANEATNVVFDYTCTWAFTVNFIVDGENTLKGRQTSKGRTGALASGSSENPVNGQFIVPIEAGVHTIEVVMDSQMERLKTQDQADRSNSFFHFTKVTLNGDIIGREEDKKYYIEAVGDSITGGCASLAYYDPGKLGDNLKYNKASSSYAYYLGNMIDADISNVSLGGLGLTGSGSQEDIAKNEPQLDNIYPYQDYNDMWDDVPYNFSQARTPDLVLLTIGANDGAGLTLIDNWKAEAKAMIQMVKEKNGDVPILWVCRAGKALQYKTIRELITEDPDMQMYDNLDCTASFYYDGNARQTIYTQTAGHPDPTDQYRGAERLYNYIVFAGILSDGVEEPKNTEYVYYVDENGDDTAAGTEAAPLKTVKGAVAKAKADNESFEEDGVLHIYTSGQVELTNEQSVAGISNVSTQVKRADGTLLPFIIETKDFDGSNRAQLNDNYTPGNAGQLRIYSLQPITFKNVSIYATKAPTISSKPASVNLYSAMNTSTVFDNVTFGNAAGTKWIMQGSPFTYVNAFDKFLSGEEEATGSLEFRNMKLTSDTFSDIAVVTGVNIWRDEKLGGSITSAPHFSGKIIFGENTEVDGSLVRFHINTLQIKEETIEMKTGSRMTGLFKGTYSGGSSNTYNYTANMNFIISGGKVDVEYFHMIGSYNNITGNLHFTMYEGEIYTTGTGNASDYKNGILLGGGGRDTTINGNVTNEIYGGLLYLTDANASSSSIISGGGGTKHVVTGDLTNHFQNGAFFLVSKDLSGSSSSSGFYLAHGDGAVQGTLTNNLLGGVYDVTAHFVSSTSTSGSGNFYAGGKNVSSAIYRMNTTIGETVGEGIPGIGPQFCNIIFNNGSLYGQFGVKSYSAKDFDGEVPDEDVVTFTCHGGTFPSGYVTATPPAVNTTGSVTSFCYVAGNVRVTIMDGKFAGTDSRGLRLFCGTILGSAEADITGGFFQHITGTDTAKATASIAKGLSINISGAQSYSPTQDPSTADKWYRNFYPVGVCHVGADEDGKSIKVNISDSNLDNVYLYAVGSASVIDGTVEYNVTSGHYRKVENSSAQPGKATAPVISGGSYMVKPAAALLKSGYELADSDITGYRYDVVPEGTGTLHAGHCFCGGNCDAATVANGHTCVTGSIDWEPLQGNISGIPAVANTTSYYFLKGDTNITNQCTLAANQKLYICLNGHELSRKGKLFLVGLYGDAELHICDCSKEKTGTAIDTDTAWDNIAGFCQGYDFSKAGTTKTLIEIYGGTIIASVIGERTGGAIHLSTGNVFNMYGGTIKPNTAAPVSKTKGQVYVGEKAVMNMYGGTIEGGRSEANGANLYIAGTVNMKGGLIDDAQSTAAGANIYVQSSTSVLNMSGGTIQNGKSNGVGGNILTNGIIRMTGGTIQGGTGSDIYSGNIYANGTTAKFYLSGGEIKNGGTEVRGCNELALSGSIKISNLCLDYMDSSAPNTVYRIGDASGYKALDSDAAIQLGFCIVNGGSSVGPDRVVFKDGTADDAKKFTCSNEAKKLVADTKGGITGLYLEDKPLDEHKHCICGGNCSAATETNNHTCNDNVVWTALSGTTIPVTANTTSYYYLASDINLSEQCTLAANQKVYICLNGHKLTRKGKLFLVGYNGDAEIHICDCSSNHSGIIKNTDIGWANHSAFAQGYSKDNSKATIEVYGGTIKGSVGKADVGGGALVNVVSNTVFNMYGGTLLWNEEQTTKYNPLGLVNIAGTGHMNMYGGTISGGRTTGNGANIYVSGTAQFNMYGGTVENGKADTNGGNITLYNDSVVNLKGGTVKGGQAKAGANIYLNGANTKLNIYDGATITGGTATSIGGNIGAWNGGTVHMYGGLVENGVAASYGGNLGASHDTGATKALVIDDGIIRGGESKSSYGGNICWNGAITVNDGEISGGKANKAGGNIYGMNGIALVTINGGTIKDGQSEVYGGNVYSCGKIAITGGEITGGYAKSSGGNVALEVLTRENSLEISGGTIKDGKITTGNGANVFVKAPNSTVTVSGGTISGGTSVYTGPNFYVSEAAKVEITGTDQAMPIFEEGTVTGTGNKLVNNIVIGDGIETRISGGKFSSPNGYGIYLRGTDYSKNSVTGGYFIGTPIVADGAKPIISGGYFTVKPGTKYLVDDGNPDTADTFVKDLGENPFEAIDGQKYQYTIAQGYKVTINAAALTGDLISVIGLQGAGYYEEGAPITLNAAKDSNGYRFVKWMDESKDLGTDTTLTLGEGVSKHTSITVMYRFGEEKLSLNVSAPETNTVKVTKPDTTSVVNTEDAALTLTDLARGSYTIEFLGDAAAFQYWTNESGNVVSKDAAYTFDMTISTTLTPVYMKAAETMVVYCSDSGQIIRTERNLADFGSYEIPMVGARAGYEGKWVFLSDRAEVTKAELETRLGTNSCVEIVSEYEKKADQAFALSLYKVVIEETVPSKEELTKDTLLKAYEAEVGVPTQFEAFGAETGETFVGIFDADGNLVSSNAEMYIRPLSKAKDSYFAVYTTGEPEEQKPTTAITDVTVLDQLGDGSKYTLAITAAFNVPETYTVLETGIIYIPDMAGTYTEDAKADAALYKGGTDVRLYISSMKEQAGTVTLNMKNIVKATYGDMKFFTKAYLIYKDDNGVEGIIYSDMSVSTVNGILGE